MKSEIMNFHTNIFQGNVDSWLTKIKSTELQLNREINSVTKVFSYNKLICLL